MYIYLIYFFESLITALFYRIKGGGFIKSTDFIVRLLFSCVFASIFYYHHAIIDIAYIASGIMIFSCFIAQCIGHSAYQGMGNGTIPKWTYIAPFLPRYTNTQWLALPMWRRTLNDMLGMASVGLWRGTITFIPPLLYLNRFHFHVSYFIPVLILVIWHPIAYLSGYFVPFSLGKSLRQQTAWSGTEWSELLTGFGWWVAQQMIILT